MKKGLELADFVIATAAVSLVVGLGMVYFPLAFILPSVGYLAWEGWRRWHRQRG